MLSLLSYSSTGCYGFEVSISLCSSFQLRFLSSYAKDNVNRSKKIDCCLAESCGTPTGQPTPHVRVCVCVPFDADATIFRARPSSPPQNCLVKKCPPPLTVSGVRRCDKSKPLCGIRLAFGFFVFSLFAYYVSLPNTCHHHRGNEIEFYKCMNRLVFLSCLCRKEPNLYVI